MADWLGLPAGGRALILGDATSAAGVVVLPEVFGVVPGVLDYAERLARKYRVHVVDYWARTPAPSMDTPEATGTAVALVDDGVVMADVSAARLALGGRRAAILGFCLGGLYARMGAGVVPGFAGAVEFYGRIVYPTLTDRKPIQPLDLLHGRSCPLLAHFGELDPIAPAAHVDELEARLGRQAAPARVYRYPGCGHAFMNVHRPGWNADTAAVAWDRTERFLADVLVVDA